MRLTNDRVPSYTTLEEQLAAVTYERDVALRRLEGLASSRLCAEFARVDSERAAAIAERDQARRQLEGVARQVGWPTKEEEEAGQTIVDRVADAVDDARGERDLLYGQFICFAPGCGVRRTHKTDKERCPCAREESGGHEWNLTKAAEEIGQLRAALLRVTEERDSTSRELQRVDEARLLALAERDEAAKQAFEAMAKSLDTQS
jgi:hypothetical protein